MIRIQAATQAVRHLRHQVQKSPKIVLDCIALLIIGHFSTEVASICSKLFPKWSLEKADWFWSPNFKMQMEHQWYLKYAGDGLLWMITYYLFAKIAAKFSNALFIVAVIFFGYHIIDAFMFWWDFNSQFYMYLDILYTAIILTKYAILPYKEERLARIKSLF